MQLNSLPTHEKLLWIKSMIDKNMISVIEGANEITVNRDNLFADSIASFAQIQNMKKVLKVSFVNEVSKDVGGISREFFTTIMREMLQEAFGLFSVANTE